MDTTELNNVRIASPCNVPWESMKGDDKVRHCSQCQLNVYNLSNVTAQEATKLVGKEGSLCIVLYRRADGTIITRDCPVGIAKVKRCMKLTLVVIGSFLTGSVLFHTIFQKELQEDFERKKAFDEARFECGLQAKGKVVYCVKDIEEGMYIPPESLEEKEVEQSKIPMDAMTSASLCVGCVAKYPLSQGQILSQHDLKPMYVKSSGPVSYKICLEAEDREKINQIAEKFGESESELLTRWVKAKMYGVDEKHLKLNYKRDFHTSSRNFSSLQ